MPDAAGSPPPLSFTVAIAAVETRFGEHPLGARRLEPTELSTWRHREAAAGWELRVTFADGERRLLVLVRRCFPFDMPRVVLVDRPPFLAWPHVEGDGTLCIGDASTSPSVVDPAAVVLERLAAAASLVEDLVGGRLGEHLRDEFLTYWLHDADDAGPPIFSLLDPEGPTRAIRLWRGERFRLVGEDNASVSAWLRNSLGLQRRRALQTEAALLVRLPAAPVPPYPRTGFEMHALLGDDGTALSALDQVLRPPPERVDIVLGVTCDQGPALAAVSLRRPPKLRGVVDPVTKGFRPGHLPSDMAADRFLRGAMVTRSVVRRVDAAWVHGRGRDPRQPRLQAARVMIVGCGSVGAPIAVALARAGVGHLQLLDGEVFATANVGRHPLGMGSVDRPKASALAARIAVDCPHVDVVAHDRGMETLLGSSEATFAGCDLVISATANWPAEAMLDAWQAGRSGGPPIVYGWTEAHACAGHGVVTFPEGPRLMDGFDPTGRPLLTVTAWPADQEMQAEPACSGRFQPYGPVELGFVTSMLADLALDVLLGTIETSTHRVWVAKRGRVQASGGQWSEAWKAQASAAPDGAVMVDLPWPPASPLARSRLWAA